MKRERRYWPPLGIRRGRNKPWHYLAAMLVVSVLLGCSTGHLNGRGASPRWCSSVIAHRAGGREVGLPDNSLAAVHAALIDELAMLEVDIRWTSDGQAVLFHDKRLRNDPWIVPEELVGREVSSLSRMQLEQICTDGTRRMCIPSFSALLTVLREGEGKVELDIKGSPTREQFETLISDMMQRGLSQRVSIFCDPLSECERVFEISSQIRVFARVHQPEDLETLLNRQPWAVQVDEDMLTDPRLDDLRARGVLVMVKTLEQEGDTSQHWRSLRQRGVDMILTDYPRAASTVLCGTATQSEEGRSE